MLSNYHTITPLYYHTISHTLSHTHPISHTKHTAHLLCHPPLQVQRAHLAQQRYRDEVRRLTERNRELDEELTRLEQLRLATWAAPPETHSSAPQTPPRTRASASPGVTGGSGGASVPTASGGSRGHPEPRSPGRAPAPTPGAGTDHTQRLWDSGTGYSEGQRTARSQKLLATQSTTTTRRNRDVIMGTGDGQAAFAGDGQAAFADDVSFSGEADGTGESQGSAATRAAGWRPNSSGKMERTLAGGGREVVFPNGTRKQVRLQFEFVPQVLQTSTPRGFVFAARFCKL